MRNIKFGVFGLVLLAAIVTVVSSLGAQARVQPRPDVMVLNGRGAQLGVMASDVDPKAAAGGVKIDEVNDDSPAAKAGLRAGDIVVDYDGDRVRSARQFTRLVQETPEGRSVAIGIVRDGKKQTVNATPEAGRLTWDFRRESGNGSWEPGAGNREPEFHLRELPDFNFEFHDMPRRFEYRLPEEFRFPTPGSRFPITRGGLGVSVQSITPELAEYFGAKNGGALVSSVVKESAAARAGIRAGDVIVSINGKAVSDADELVDELAGITGEATIVVVRDKKEMTLKATIERPSPVL